MPWLRILLLLAAAYAVVVVLAWLLQRRMMYLPDARAPSLPPDAAAAGFEDVAIPTADREQVRAFFAPGERPTTLLLLHGNAGNRGDRLDWMRRYHARGWGVMLLDWRGYGGSSGSPTEAGLVADANAALDWLAARGCGRVALVGESIGCGVAVRVAARRPVVGLALHAGAVSLVPVGRHAFPWLPIGWLLRDRFDVAEEAGRVQAPALCVHGDLDEIVPPAVGRALCDRLGGPTTWRVVEGAGHNDLLVVGGRDLQEAVVAFLAGLDDG